MDSMTETEKSKGAALDRLADAFVDDLMSLSDEELRAEIAADHGDPAAFAGAARAVFNRAIATCGKDKLARAKAAVAVDRARRSNVTRLDPKEARRRLASVVANDAETHRKLTLAARKGERLSDNDVAGMLEDLTDLGVAPPAGEPGQEGDR